jgi:hypothetical protein
LSLNGVERERCKHEQKQPDFHTHFCGREWRSPADASGTHLPFFQCLQKQSLQKGTRENVD